MGNKKKVGKQRRDKFYHLAKETGYRSRAAFKLIQLNRKFEFLQKSQVCVDLCAAPGGWMQVARQNMPVSSVVIGVDLFPIKPVPGCIGLVEDITTEKCRVALKKELSTWKADVILNDGAPNVGKNWLHDAYTQACLTLSALKLATNFLKKGGWFVTKLFRSKDYNALIWVFKQFFKKVHATKPQASRNESAEIFVVCQSYIAPDKIDAKFLDPKYVFSDVEDDVGRKKLNIMHPEQKKKAKAEGYPENDYTLHYKLPVSKFIASVSGVDELLYASEIAFDDTEILNHPLTTEEIKECCSDIKVLGRRELKLLIGWWKAMKELRKPKDNQIDNAENANDDEKLVQIKLISLDEQEDAEYEDIQKQIANMNSEEAHALKRKHKQKLKEKRKLHQKLNLQMVIKGDQGPQLEDDDMFSLKKIASATGLSQVSLQTDADIVAESSDDDDQPKNKYVKFNKETSELDESGTYYKHVNSGDDESDSAIENGDNDDDKDSFHSQSGDDLSLDEVDNEETNEDTNPLFASLDNRSKNERRTQKVNLWFERDSLKNVIDDDDEDYDLNRAVQFDDAKNPTSEVKSKVSKMSKAGENADMNDQDSDYDFNIEPKVVKKKSKLPKLDENGLALGALMIQSAKTKRDIVDDAWNRYTFNDDNLPDWFVEDEQKHMKREAPVPKELVDTYKKKLEDLNVRPIKKIIEAKARKKRRSIRKFEKAKKKIEAIMDNTDISDREKARQAEKLYRKSKATPKKEVTYVVAKKYTAGKRMRRPPGVKGRYKAVDPRMKKDMRAAKNKEKTKGRSKKGKIKPKKK